MQYDEYTQGWNSPIQYNLLHDGVSFNATGMTPSLVLTDKNGNPVSFQGTVTWANAAQSQIQFTPAPGDLLAASSPYKLHWKVTDLNGNVAFYPQGAPILLTVYPQ